MVPTLTWGCPFEGLFDILSVFKLCFKILNEYLNDEIRQTLLLIYDTRSKEQFTVDEN